MPVPGLSPASGVAIIWIWRGFPLSPHFLHPAESSKDGDSPGTVCHPAQEDGFLPVSSASDPSFLSSDQQSPSDLSSSTNVDVQHQFEDMYFPIPIHLKSGRFLQVPFKGHIKQSRAHTFSLSLALWLLITGSLLLLSTLRTQCCTNSG